MSIVKHQSQEELVKHGLVLSGGGARGAYEAGVLYYLYVSGSAELREQVHRLEPFM